MAHAILFPTPMPAKESGAMKGKRSLSSKDLPFSEARLSQARTVLRETPELAAKVRDGFPLNHSARRESRSSGGGHKR
jgi:hypothetical protein